MRAERQQIIECVPVGDDDSRTTASHSASDAAADLARVASSVEDFLCRHVLQLAEVIKRCQDCLAREEAVGRLKDDLLRQQSEWEAQRQAEASQINEEHSRIIAAWEQLEAEQRRLAAQIEARRFDEDAGYVSGGPLAQSYGETSAHGRPNQEAVASDLRYQAARSEVLRSQFEQLKREVENHARRARRLK